MPETVNRNIVDVTPRAGARAKSTASPISREDVDQLESVITKTIENTNVKEMEAEIEKIMSERKAATEKVLEIDPELQSIVTADDFLPIVETFADDDFPKPSLPKDEPGKRAEEPSDSDYVVDDAADAEKDEAEAPKTTTKIARSEATKVETATAITTQITSGKIDDVTIRTENEKVSAKNNEIKSIPPFRFAAETKERGNIVVSFR